MRLPAHPTLISLVALAGLALALQLSAQLRLKGFRYPFYEKQATNQTSRIKGLVTGNRAVSQANALYHVQGMRIELYASDLSTNLVAHAPECFLDQVNSAAFSTNTLEIKAANGQLTITGRQFHCNLADNSLTLSNDVKTIIDQTLAQSSRAAQQLTPDIPFPTPNPPSNTNTNTSAQILINSDRLEFHSLSNRVIYTGHVQVFSAQMDMTCQKLTVQFSTNNSIDRIIANHDVVLASKQGSGSAQGRQAVYQTTGDQELLTLHGQPARWVDGPRRGQAARFVFNLTAKTVRAEENALVQLPKTSLNQSDWLLANPGAPPPTNQPLTNNTLEIRSSVITVHFPTPQQPGRSLFAETNVVISNPSENSLATSHQASYREANGIIELIGNAVWKSDNRVVKGDLLFFDRTNLIFRATSNAYLGLPIAALGNAILPLPNPKPQEGPAPTPRSLEVFAEKYHYKPGLLEFVNNVWLNLFEDTDLVSQLSCKRLRLTLSPNNQVQQIFADHDVTLDQFPPPTQSIEILQQQLKCENLIVTLSTNGRVHTIVAQNNVVAQKTERQIADPTPPPTTTTTTMRANLVTALFFPHTNAVESIIAENNVLITQGQRWAQGSRATFWSTNNMVELSGNPIAQAPEGRITDAEVLLWDRTRSRFMVRELRARGDNLPGANNIPPLRPRKP